MEINDKYALLLSTYIPSTYLCKLLNFYIKMDTIQVGIDQYKKRKNPKLKKKLLTYQLKRKQYTF